MQIEGTHGPVMCPEPCVGGQVEIGNMDISLKYFEEVYTTEHWMVRVYRVLDQCAPRCPG